MLGTGFARQIVAPAGDGQPTFVAVPVHWAADVIAAHPVAWDVPFAAIQLLIGLGLLVRRTTRVALAVSIAWSLGVWYFGEGLSGLASGHASLLTGAPGSALLYGVLAAAAWPRPAPARWFPVAWSVLWIGGAVFQALPGQNTGRTVAASLSAPGGFEAWISRHGPVVVAALAAAEALIGLAALHPRTRTIAAATGFAVAVAISIFGQNLGQLWSGQATDPNSAPLIALMAIALIGSRGAHAVQASPASQERRSEVRAAA
jgi:hypothetical protein